MPPLTRADAAHLVRRTGFGVTDQRIDRLVGLTRRAAVDRVLDTSRNPAATIPDSVFGPGLEQWQVQVRLTWWWMQRMIDCPAPISEKLTLFWHGHFTTGQSKIYRIDLIARQNQLLRSRALGTYRQLAQAIAVDPAMLLYLDNSTNRAGAVQENFGRELLELFTLGRGNYSEADVVAMSRAWTGHTLDSSAQYRFEPAWHDSGAKTLFGITKDWDGPAALDEVLRGSTADIAARHITAKLFSFLVYPVAPGDAVVGELAAKFRASGLRIRTLVRSILLRPEFWSGKARFALVRSPVEFFVAAMEGLGFGPDLAHPEWWDDAAGQILFDPPNVAGWKHGASWISTSSMWSKAAFASYVRWRASESGLFDGYEKLSPRAATTRAFGRFGVHKISPSTRASVEALHRRVVGTWDQWSLQPSLVPAVLLSPEFQVA